MGGPLWSKRDEGAWTIPKGLIERGEDPYLTARREFEEEVGTLPEGNVIPLGPIRQKSGKTVHAWAIEGDFDPGAQKSNSFSMEWPPRSGRSEQFPELDRVEWFTIEKACQRSIAGQAELFLELERKLASA